MAPQCEAQDAGAQARNVRSICRCCSALCGIVVALEGDTVVSVRGDKDNARSQGYICPKGASLPAFHHHPDNLLTPRFKNGTNDWNAGLDDLAQRLRAVMTKYGPDAVGMYQGNGTVADGFARGGLLARFMAAIGSSQFYSAASIDVMPALRAAEMVCGSAELLPIWRDDEPQSRLVIFWGINPLVSHGYVTQFPNPVNRIAAFRKRGGKVWVVDPRGTKASTVADHHLPIHPGADAVLLAWLIRELLHQGADMEDLARTTTAEDRARLVAAVEPFTRDVAITATGLPAADLDELLAQIRAAGRIAIVSGTGINFGRNALVTDWLRWVLLIITGSMDRRGGMWFSPGWISALEKRPAWPATPPEGWVAPGTKSRPDLPRLMAQNAAIGIVDEIEAGNIRALIVAGSNPLLSFPAPERLERAMKSLDTLVVIDVLETSFTRLATDVLAASGQLERSDILIETFTTLMSPALVPPLGERRHLWWMLAQVARRLGAELINGQDPDTLTEDTMLRNMAAAARDGADALFDAGVDGRTAPALYGWVREKALIAGRWRLVPPGLAERLPAVRDEVMTRGRGAGELMLIAGRHLTRVNATRYVTGRKTRDLPRIHIHPNDAEKRQLRNGDHVAMRSANGRMAAILEIDDIVREGVVWMSHGWLEANVGNLTSGVHGVDPLTGQPEMTAIVVTLDRAA
jgi:anaerobic selenocysteine-containing dehydrogenase